MIEKIALGIGYTIIVSFGFVFIGFLWWLGYMLYDEMLRRTLGWNNIKLRKDLLYFIKHKKEIRSYIKMKMLRTKDVRT